MSNRTIVDIEAGERMVLALTSDGNLYGYSRANGNAQAGDGTNTGGRYYFVYSSAVMNSLQGGERILNIYASFANGVVSTNFGRLLGWGNNDVSYCY
jgi:alpha-tubulin suppressor-like RCC1 family protein